MATGQLGRRLDRLAADRTDADRMRTLWRLAAITGISESELLAESERIALRCRQEGITAYDGMVHLYAAELGMAPEELEREIADLVEQLA